MQLKEAAQWIIRKMNSEFLLAAGYRKHEQFCTKRETFQIRLYLFDNGMVMTGLLNLYKISRKKDLLQVCKQHGRFFVKYFFNGSNISKQHCLIRFYKPVAMKEVKWSTIPGAYHSKLSLGFLELSKLTDNTNYARISECYL